jgi:hypothetical protein
MIAPYFQGGSPIAGVRRMLGRGAVGTFIHERPDRPLLGSDSIHDAQRADCDLR